VKAHRGFDRSTMWFQVPWRMCAVRGMLSKSSFGDLDIGSADHHVAYPLGRRPVPPPTPAVVAVSGLLGNAHPLHRARAATVSADRV